MTKLTLAITTIGDLLLNNKLSKDENGEEINDIQLSIPEYQRPYKWTPKNTLQLLDDIKEALTQNKEVYRIGTLILHNDSDCYKIVDGQQRTITLALLLDCLLGGQNIQFLNKDITDNPHSLHNIYYNHKALERQLNHLDEKEKDKLSNYIQKRCELIVVITDDLSEAFQFFDSQNARGKKLYPHDLLKAYHLREMNNLDNTETEHVVTTWEELNQKKLSELFNDYLYCVREWIKGNKADELSEKNIDLFKGVNANDNYPYAQFYKGAFAYCNGINVSYLPFVTGGQQIRPFQLNAPIVAGKPFFEYAKYYYNILADIQDNYNYDGYFIFDNEIIKTLDQKKYQRGVGNKITRRMLDSAILLYIDRFCPSIPSQQDTDMLEQFVIYAFIWAYSMRAQYSNVGWRVAQNYILGTPGSKKISNAINLYKLIADSDSPNSLLTMLANKIGSLDDSKIVADKTDWEKEENGVRINYLFYFNKHKFWEAKTNEK